MPNSSAISHDAKHLDQDIFDVDADGLADRVTFSVRQTDEQQFQVTTYIALAKDDFKKLLTHVSSHAVDVQPNFRLTDFTISAVKKNQICSIDSRTQQYCATSNSNPCANVPEATFDVALQLFGVDRTEKNPASALGGKIYLAHDATFGSPHAVIGNMVQPTKEITESRELICIK